MYREVSGISREAVDAAFPGMLAAPPPPDAPVPCIEYAPPTMSNPTQVLEAAPPELPREPVTEGQRHYRDLMTRMGWGRL